MLFAMLGFINDFGSYVTIYKQNTWKKIVDVVRAGELVSQLVTDDTHIKMMLAGISMEDAWLLLMGCVEPQKIYN